MAQLLKICACVHGSLISLLSASFIKEGDKKDFGERSSISGNKTSGSKADTKSWSAYTNSRKVGSNTANPTTPESWGFRSVSTMSQKRLVVIPHQSPDTALHLTIKVVKTNDKHTDPTTKLRPNDKRTDLMTRPHLSPSCFYQSPLHWCPVDNSWQVTACPQFTRYNIAS